ncbi:MAG: hypothetical protein U1F53_06500 [Burkholderiaceae bacterium]
MFTSLRVAIAALALTVTALTLALPARAEKAGAYHIFPTAEYLAKTGRSRPEAPPPAGSMLYYGGSVLANAKVVSVIWGPNVKSATVTGIPDFTKALVNSTYVDQLSPQYDTFLNAQDGRKGTQQHIARGSFLGQVQITPLNTSLNLTNDDVWKELKAQIKLGTLPKNDLNTLYMVYFPLNVTITLDGITSCIDYGAYHFAKNDVKMAKNNIFYSVEPDCNYSFNTITYIAAHEFVEAVTDNIPTPGSNPAFPQAWNNSTGYEIGDLCGGSGTLTAGAKSYNVTQYYLNTTGHCSTGNYTSP